VVEAKATEGMAAVVGIEVEGEEVVAEVVVEDHEVGVDWITERFSLSLKCSSS
jgi:hypothetical protein